MNKQLQVEGMTCMHCKMRVEKALKAIKGVKAVDVDLSSKLVRVEMKSEIENQVLVNAVIEAGYQAMVK